MGQHFGWHTLQLSIAQPITAHFIGRGVEVFTQAQLPRAYLLHNLTNLIFHVITLDISSLCLPNFRIH